jgi:tubulin gamma
MNARSSTPLMRGGPTNEDPLPPAPVVTACFGHAGIGIGSEAFRQTLLEVGADPTAPTVEEGEDHDRLLERYGTTVMRLGDRGPRSDEIPLIPRALLCDLDPRSSNLILQSYPELFGMRDKHVVTGNGGAARNWAEGRRRFLEEISQTADFAEHLEALAPEEARGYQVPFSMGGGTGSSFACTFLEKIKEQGGRNEMTASIGVLPDFGYDPVIYGTACINITMNLDYQIRYSDCPILLDNARLRDLAIEHKDQLQGQSSIVDDLQTTEQEVAWQEYREMNMVAARFLSTFTASFTRETEWDFSNYRTWLSQKPKFVIPWLIPVVPEEGGFLSKPDASVEALVQTLQEGKDAVLFDFEGEVPEGGRRDGACVLVKVKGEFTRDDRQVLKNAITERFPSINERRIIFVRIPSVETEPAGACVLLNTKSIGPRMLEFVEEAEAVWDDFKSEYVKAGLEEEEFKESVVRVINHFS